MVELTLYGIVDEKTGKRLVALAKAAGLPAELRFNSQTCKTGCATTYELLVDSDRLKDFHAIARKENERLLPDEAEGIDPEQSNIIFDPDSEYAKCPACGFTFTAKNTLECPDCGLRFG